MSVVIHEKIDLSRNKRQGEYFNAVMSACAGLNEHRFFGYGGAVRGGKTSVTLFLLILLSHKYPNSRWHTIRDTLPSLKKTTIPSIEKFLPENGWTAHRDGGDYYYDPPAPTTYTITATAGTGGSISPSGSTSVTEGNSKTYTITASSGYKISDVKVDGSSFGAASTYTFSGVSASHSISATFASAASLSTGGVTLGDGGSGTLKSGVTKSGYGITVSLPVTTSYVSGTTVTASYNFTSAKTVSLESAGGTWQFPVSGSSVTGARKIYIPVETKDGTYTITFTVKALDPQATALTGSNVYLTSTKSVTVTIRGSMYEDDFTGNS